MSSRLRHLYDILLKPLWTLVIVGMLGLMGTAAFIRDEFLDTNTAMHLKYLELLPHWQVNNWLSIGIFTLLIILFEGSYRVSISAEIHRSNLQNTLDRIGEGRPFDYSNSNWNVRGNDFQKRAPIWDVERLGIIFENTGNQVIAYSFKELYIIYNGMRIDIPFSSSLNYIHSRKRMNYGLDIKGITVLDFPAIISIGYRIEYDNVPSVRRRGTERLIEHSFKSFKPMLSNNTIVKQDEYWPE